MQYFMLKNRNNDQQLINEQPYANFILIYPWKTSIRVQAAPLNLNTWKWQMVVHISWVHQENLQQSCYSKKKLLALFEKDGFSVSMKDRHKVAQIPEEWLSHSVWIGPGPLFCYLHLNSIRLATFWLRLDSSDNSYRKFPRFTRKFPSVQLCFRTWNPRCWGLVPTL
jgi:hypothetical protein